MRHGRVEWVHGDAQTLPFADGDFDAARVERVLMHVADPRAWSPRWRASCVPAGA